MRICRPRSKRICWPRSVHCAPKSKPISTISHRGEKLREGLCFAITGAPNVGKSSLINALAERDVAIVSATPGTTRDAIETRVVLGGVPVTLVDTAGLRDTTDPIEAEGVRRARARAAAADLVITVIEAGSPFDGGRWLGRSPTNPICTRNKDRMCWRSAR